MGCGGSKHQTLTFQRGKQTITVNPKQKEIIEKWGLGCVARRRFKKLVQLTMLKNLRKPLYVDGNLVLTKEVLINDDDIKWSLSVSGAGKSYYWNTKEKTLEDDKKYIGQWKKSTKSTKGGDYVGGLGTMKFKDGSMYQGYSKNNQFHGKGRMTHSNGDIYQGEWKEGKAEGNGVFVDKQGMMYEGKWENDQYHGKGVESWKYNKIIYTGDFNQGQKTGKGKFEFDGNVYEGDFVDGQFHGQGKYFFADSEKIYEGEFFENRMQGKGMMVWKDGSKY
jgi:hypothetical protein